MVPNLFLSLFVAGYYNALRWRCCPCRVRFRPPTSRRYFTRDDGGVLQRVFFSIVPFITRNRLGERGKPPRRWRRGHTFTAALASASKRKYFDLSPAMQHRRQEFHWPSHLNLHNNLPRAIALHVNVRTSDSSSASFLACSSTKLPSADKKHIASSHLLCKKPERSSRFVRHFAKKVVNSSRKREDTQQRNGRSFSWSWNQHLCSLQSGNTCTSYGLLEKSNGTGIGIVKHGGEGYRWKSAFKCQVVIKSIAGTHERASRGNTAECSTKDRSLSDGDILQRRHRNKKAGSGLQGHSTGLLISSGPRRNSNSVTSSVSGQVPVHNSARGDDGDERSRDERKGSTSGDSNSMNRSKEETRRENGLHSDGGGGGDQQVKQISELYVAAAGAATAALENMSRAEMLMAEAAKAATAAHSLHASKTTGHRPQGGALPGEAAHVEHTLLPQVAVSEQRAANRSFVDAGVTLQRTGRTRRMPRRDLWLLSLSASLPFVGFGLVDNCVMILAGDMFDTTLCVALGLSTMAAAALGNWISDLMGLWLGSTIEGFTSRTFAIPKPRLSKEEMESPLCRRYYYIGTGLGISIGCLLGMAPLLFLDTKEGERLKQQREQAKTLHTDVAQAIAGYLRAERVVIYLLDPQEKAFRTEIDGYPVQIPLDAGIPGRVYATGLLVNWRASFQDDAAAESAAASVTAAAEASAKERRIAFQGTLSPLCIGGSALPQPADLLPCCTRADRVAAAAEAAAEDEAPTGEETPIRVSAASAPAAGETVTTGAAATPTALASEGATSTEATSHDGAASATAAAMIATGGIEEIVERKEGREKVVNLQQWAKVFHEKLSFARRGNIESERRPEGRTYESIQSRNDRRSEGGCCSTDDNTWVSISNKEINDDSAGSDVQRNSTDSFQKPSIEVNKLGESSRDAGGAASSAASRTPAPDIGVSGAVAVASTGDAAAAAAPAAGVPAAGPSPIKSQYSRKWRLFGWLSSLSLEYSDAARGKETDTAAAERKAAEVIEAAADAEAEREAEAAEAGGDERLRAMTGRTRRTQSPGKRGRGDLSPWSSSQQQNTGAVTKDTTASPEALANRAASIAASGAEGEEASRGIAATFVVAAETEVNASKEAIFEEKGAESTKECCDGEGTNTEGGPSRQTPTATEAPAAQAGAAADVGAASAVPGNLTVGPLETPQTGEAAAATVALLVTKGANERDPETTSAYPVAAAQSTQVAGVPVATGGEADKSTRAPCLSTAEAAVGAVGLGTRAAEETGGLGRCREAPTTDFPVNEAAAPRRECKQILGAPIFGFDGDIIGVVEVINPIDRLCFSRKDKDFLLSICPHIAVEVEGRQHLTNILEICRKQVASHNKKSKKSSGKNGTDASASSSSSSSPADDEESSSGSPADSISLFASKFFT